MAKYNIWLNSLKTINPQKEYPKKEGLSLKQKILALHYLGLDLNQTYKTTLSEVLSLIIGLDKSNTKKAISELMSAKREEDIKTNENLLKMLEIFDNKNFTEIKLEIKKDLEKFGVSD